MCGSPRQPLSSHLTASRLATPCLRLRRNRLNPKRTKSCEETFSRLKAEGISGDLLYESITRQTVCGLVHTFFLAKLLSFLLGFNVGDAFYNALATPCPQVEIVLTAHPTQVRRGSQTKNCARRILCKLTPSHAMCSPGQPPHYPAQAHQDRDAAAAGSG